MKSSKLKSIYFAVLALIYFELYSSSSFNPDKYFENLEFTKNMRLAHYEKLMESTSPNSVFEIDNKISSSNHISQGENVCLNKVIYHVPYQSKESYQRPVHIFQTADGKECSSLNSVCHYSRTELKKFWRTFYDVKSEQKLEYGCCPGWNSYSKEKNACTQAICERKCLNGGTCIAPNTCTCESGWTGELCEKDIDECLDIVKPRCDQVCVNTPGGFKCKCRKGFKLDKNDNFTCQICLDCLPEYKKVTKLVKDHTTQISKLKKKSAATPVFNISSIVEAVKESLISSQTVLEIGNKSDHESTIDYYDYDQDLPIFSDHIHAPLSNQLLTGKGKRGTKKSVLIVVDEVKIRRALERIEFMNQQIGVLEEKLGKCKCEA